MTDLLEHQINTMKAQVDYLLMAIKMGSYVAMIDQADRLETRARDLAEAVRALARCRDAGERGAAR